MLHILIQSPYKYKGYGGIPNICLKIQINSKHICYKYENIPLNVRIIRMNFQHTRYKYTRFSHTFLRNTHEFPTHVLQKHTISPRMSEKYA
jgi:hypothetical protein